MKQILLILSVIALGFATFNFNPFDLNIGWLGLAFAVGSLLVKDNG